MMGVFDQDNWLSQNIQAFGLGMSLDDCSIDVEAEDALLVEDVQKWTAPKMMVLDEP